MSNVVYKFRYWEGFLTCTKCKYEARRRNLRFSKTPGIVYQCPFCKADIGESNG